MNWSDPIQAACANWQAFKQADFVRFAEALWDEDFDVDGAYSLLPVERQPMTFDELETRKAVYGIPFEEFCAQY